MSLFAFHRRLAGARFVSSSLIFITSGALFFDACGCRAAYANAQALLDGYVLGLDSRPVSGIRVQLTGQNLTLKATSNASGHFAFTTVPSGEYVLSADAGTLHAQRAVSLTGDAATVLLSFGTLKEIGNTSVSSSAPAQHSGTDVNISSVQLAHSPSGSSLSDILTQLPSAARGSNGQIHLNGDHNGQDYVIDGVQLPASLNRVLGNEIDPADIGSIEVLQGAYPAQYGDRFASVIEVNTKAPTGPAGGSGSIEVGSYGRLDTTVGYHAPLAGGGAVTIGLRNEQDNRGIDPPVQQFVHDRSSDGSQFVRISVPAHGADTFNADILHSHQTFQIPPDTANGVPSTTDDDEYQDDTFTSLIYRHDINGHGSLSFGPSLKVSHIVDTNDLQNDLAPALNPPAGPATSPPGTNCTDFTDCPVFSVAANRLSHDYRFNADYVLSSPHHEIRSGILYDATVVEKDYQITLQPYTALNPNGTFTATDTTPNTAHEQEAYLQDTWKMGRRYVLDYGLRADAFQVVSSQFDQGFSQTSPRLKLTRIFTPRASVYAYYGRLFVPFSFENVSPQTAAELFTTSNNPGTTFDLRPQRDSLYELGGHLPIGKGELGVRVAHKVSSDWIDDTQVGATNLHQDINFPQGRVDIETGYFTQPLQRNGKIYASLTHSIAVNSLNCETQLLQNCAASGPPGGGFVQADHDQHWDMNTGLILNDAHRGWFSFDSEYGSGLSLGEPSDCSTDDAVNCKVPPHLVFGLEKGVATGPDSSVALIMRNLLNDHYAFTLDSSLQGTHYADPRTIYLQFKYKE